MGEVERHRWFLIALLVALIYTGTSVGTAALAGAAASHTMQIFWRWSAFGIAGVVFLAHVAFERFALRSGTRTIAWHAAIAAALGGLGLALAAIVHELASATAFRPRLLVALVAWPLLVAVPAFLFALAIGAALDAWRKD
jgi:hypothetical protein